METKSKYSELRRNPPVLKIKNNAREVVIDLISCMCDNRYKFTLKKNEEGDFKLKTHGYSYSNFLINADKDEIEWEADDNNWRNVINMINSGTSAIEKIRSR